MINYDRENSIVRGLAKVKSRHQAGANTMRLETCLECIGSIPKVLGAFQDGTKEFTGRRLRLVGRLLGIAEKLVGRVRSLIKLGGHVTDGIAERGRGINRQRKNKRWSRWPRTRGGMAGGAAGGDEVVGGGSNDAREIDIDMLLVLA
ncbi:hypothetical protein B296_00047622 [Ensete ventricosum]|uniref:Uncharacterized protein n=1 Tax=Ensete ventricosum TaxID=4639 RepID=A0A426YG31_ENSVE|nr:hypothetical protein B296_00047622 [Ensete ventricosum]